MSEETKKPEGQKNEVVTPEIKPQPDAAVSTETGGQPPAEAQTTDSTPQEHMIPKSRLDQALQKAKELEDRLKALETEKEAATAAQEAAQQAALADQGKWEELFKQERDKLEKLEAKRRQAEADAKQARLDMLRLKVATTLDGFPRKLADRLMGETEEELLADAKAILADLPTGPAVNTQTDAKEGTNGTAPRPLKTDLEIQEEAARSGVSFDHLKQYYEQQRLKSGV